MALVAAMAKVLEAVKVAVDLRAVTQHKHSIPTCQNCLIQSKTELTYKACFGIRHGYSLSSSVLPLFEASVPMTEASQ